MPVDFLPMDSPGAQQMRHETVQIHVVDEQSAETRRQRERRADQIGTRKRRAAVSFGCNYIININKHENSNYSHIGEVEQPVWI